MSEENISIRLKVVIEELGITASEFADKCGISRATLSQLLTGRNKKVSDVIISQIHSAYPELSVMWLLFGEGEPWLSGHSKSASDPEANQQSGADDTSADYTSPGGNSTLFDFDDGIGDFGSGFSSSEDQNGVENASENPEIRPLGGAGQKYSKENGLKYLFESIKKAVHEEINNCLKSNEFINEIKNSSDNCKKISHITVYYDDSTFESFFPK